MKILTLTLMGLFSLLGCAEYAGCIPEEALSPGFKGGTVVGEILSVTETQQDERNALGGIELRITEVISGHFQPGIVRAEYSRRTDLILMNPSWLEMHALRAGMRLVLVLREPASASGRYLVDAYNIGLVGEAEVEDLTTLRTEAALLKIENLQERQAAMERLDFKKQSPGVQSFVLTQMARIAYLSDPSCALARLLSVLQDTQYSYGVRRTASLELQRLYQYFTPRDKDKVVTAWIEVFRDPNANFRANTLREITFITAHEDPLHGDLRINPRLVVAIDALAKREKIEWVRKAALKVQDHIRKVINQIANAAPDVPTQSRNR